MTTRQETISKGNPLFHLSNLVFSNLTLIAHKVVEVRQVVKRRITAPAGVPQACGDRSGTTCVLHIIRNSGKGVHPTVLGQMTGYEKQKLDRILHKLFKRGEIMIEAGGLYAGARPRSPYGLREI